MQSDALYITDPVRGTTRCSRVWKYWNYNKHGTNVEHWNSMNSRAKSITNSVCKNNVLRICCTKTFNKVKHHRVNLYWNLEGGGVRKIADIITFCIIITFYNMLKHLYNIYITLWLNMICIEMMNLILPCKIYICQWFT